MEQNEVILGVDMHLDKHVGAVISDAGRLLGTLSVSTDSAGYLDLLAWANSFGPLSREGVEGTGTYGAGLTRVLRDHEIEVFEVNRPDRAMRRSKGKSDPTDAENAARSPRRKGYGDPQGAVRRRRGNARRLRCETQCSQSKDAGYQ